MCNIARQYEQRTLALPQWRILERLRGLKRSPVEDSIKTELMSASYRVRTYGGLRQLEQIEMRSIGARSQPPASLLTTARRRELDCMNSNAGPSMLEKQRGTKVHSKPMATVVNWKNSKDCEQAEETIFVPNRVLSLKNDFRLTSNDAKLSELATKELILVVRANKTGLIHLLY